MTLTRGVGRGGDGENETETGEDGQNPNPERGPQRDLLLHAQCCLQSRASPTGSRETPGRPNNEAPKLRRPQELPNQGIMDKLIESLVAFLPSLGLSPVR